MNRSESPLGAYQRLLRRHQYAPPALEDWIRTSHRLEEEGRASAHTEGIMDGGVTSQPTTMFLPSGVLDGTPPTNVLIAPLAQRLEAAAAEWSLVPPGPLHAGVFPTGEFNALATRVDDGVLLLINEGLMFFAYQCMEAFGLSTTISFRGKEVGPAMSKAEATDQLADVVSAYLSKGSSAFARHVPMIGGLRGAYVNQLATAIHRFVLAHEYGHAYAGHLDSPNTGRLSLPSGELEFINKNWEQELQADLLAMRLMVPPSVRKVGPDSGGAVLNLVMALAGALAFFQLDVLLGAVEGACSGRCERHVSITHPPSELRAKRVRKWATEIRAEALIDVADSICAWLTELEAPVVRVVTRGSSR